VVICFELCAVGLRMVQVMPLLSPSSLASLKSRMVLPLWCQLTQVVLEKRLLNGCGCAAVDKISTDIARHMVTQQ